MVEYTFSPVSEEFDEIEKFSQWREKTDNEDSDTDSFASAQEEDRTRVIRQGQGQGQREHEDNRDMSEQAGYTIDQEIAFLKRMSISLNYVKNLAGDRKFSGEGDEWIVGKNVRIFVRELERCFVKGRLFDDDGQDTILRSHLEGKALEWYTNWYDKEHAKIKEKNGTVNMENAFKKLVEQYTPAKYEMLLADKVRAVKQGSRSFAEFVEEFREVRSYNFDNKDILRDWFWVETFIQAVHEPRHRELLNEYASTYKEAHPAGQVVDIEILENKALAIGNAHLGVANGPPVTNKKDQDGDVIMNFPAQAEVNVVQRGNTPMTATPAPFRGTPMGQVMLPPIQGDAERNQLRMENRCFRCRQPGHRARECPQGAYQYPPPMGPRYYPPMPPMPQGRPFYPPRGLQCFECGGMGHKQVDCPGFQGKDERRA